MTLPFDPRRSSLGQRLINAIVPMPGGLLTPEDQSMVSRGGLLNLAGSLLQSGSPQAQQRGTLGNIGFALQNLDIPGAVQSAARMRAAVDELNTQRQARQAFQDIAKKYPVTPGENEEQRFTRMSNIVTELVGVPGSEDLVGKLSNVLAQLRPQRELRSRYVWKTLPEGPNKWGQYRVNIDDPEDRIRIGDAQPPAGARTDSVLQQKARLGANAAIESIDEAERLLAGDPAHHILANPNADVLPLGAALARGAKAGGGVLGTIAGVAEPLAQQSMTPDQQQFQAAIQRMVHSMVGLLPGSRQSIVLFNSLVNAYTPQPNESAQTRTAKRQARLHARRWLDAIRRGQPVPLPPELSAAGITEGDIELAPSGEGGAVPNAPSPPAAPASPPTPQAPAYNPRWWHK